jgi:hypothetical protein
MGESNQLENSSRIANRIISSQLKNPSQKTTNQYQPPSLHFSCNEKIIMDITNFCAAKKLERIEDTEVVHPKVEYHGEKTSL